MKTFVPRVNEDTVMQRQMLLEVHICLCASRIVCNSLTGYIVFNWPLQDLST